MMRVYALYERSKHALIFLYGLSFVSLVYDVIQAFGFTGDVMIRNTLD